MCRRDIIVAGASASGVEVLRSLIGELPSDLPASIFILAPIPAWSRSELPAIFNRNSRLPAIHPQPGQPIGRGRIDITPPNHHLLIGRQKVHLSRPKKSIAIGLKSIRCSGRRHRRMESVLAD
jgi:two-component system chemotaxis response regulator CheB